LPANQGKKTLKTPCVSDNFQSTHDACLFHHPFRSIGRVQCCPFPSVSSRRVTVWFRQVRSRVPSAVVDEFEVHVVRAGDAFEFPRRSRQNAVTGTPCYTCTVVRCENVCMVDRQGAEINPHCMHGDNVMAKTVAPVETTHASSSPCGTAKTEQSCLAMTLNSMKCMWCV
jgi:hypothetical protein